MLNRFFAKPKDDGSAAAAAAVNPSPLVEALQVEAEEKASYTVAVIGAKGGVGATTLAVNLAASFASAGTATTLLDCNLQEPGIAHTLGKEPPHSLMELVLRASDLDRSLFDACAVSVDESLPQLKLITPPLNGEAGVQTNLSQIAQCIKSLRRYSTMWIIDVPRHLDRHLVTLLDSCDRIMLVFEASISGIAACQRWLATFKELGYERDRLIVVLNRSGSKYKAVEDQLPGCFGDEVILKVPNASSLAWESAMHGVPAFCSSPNHQYSKAVTRLAEHVSWSVSGR